MQPGNIMCFLNFNTLVFWTPLICIHTICQMLAISFTFFPANIFHFAYVLNFKASFSSASWSCKASVAIITRLSTVNKILTPQNCLKSKTWRKLKYHCENKFLQVFSSCACYVHSLVSADAQCLSKGVWKLPSLWHFLLKILTHLTIFEWVKCNSRKCAICVYLKLYFIIILYWNDVKGIKTNIIRIHIWYMAYIQYIAKFVCYSV